MMLAVFEASNMVGDGALRGNTGFRCEIVRHPQMAGLRRDTARQAFPKWPAAAQKR